MKIKSMLAALIALAAGSLFAGSYSNQVETAAVGPMTITCADARDWTFRITSESSAAVPGSEKGARSVVTIMLSSPVEARPPVFEADFATSGADVTHVWTTPFNTDAHRLWPKAWGKTRYNSQLAYETPLAVAMNESDRSRLAMASSEAFEKVLFGLVADERTCRLEGKFKFFTENASPRKSYTVKILVDTRDAFWGDAAHAASDWIGETAGLKPAAVPEIARDPLYSTWYAYWQDVHADELEREAPLAAKLGMKAMILDDGWQKVESRSFYSATGDWMPVASRFPDMKAHVDAIHKAGLKYMLWLSVPYVGDESQAWNRFKDKFLKVHVSDHVGVLDPRFPDVREYLIQTYERAVRDWGFDGLKLDFIDQFVLPPVDPAVKEKYAGRDYKSLPEAVDRLMKDILKRLKAINPDVLVEFRQHYMGPAIRQYGNMIRAADCPADPQANRVRIANLRLTSGETAVHADMLVWSPDETPEGAARPILSALFGVIQYSMVLQHLPKPHEGVIRHWLDFTEKHRDLLQKGTFRPHHPELNYPLIEVENAAERLFAAYMDGLLVDVGEPDKPVYLVNAAQKTGVAVSLPQKAEVELFDVYGTSLGKRKFAAGLTMIPVPPSGYARVDWENTDVLAALMSSAAEVAPIPLKEWRAYEGDYSLSDDGAEIVVDRTGATKHRSGASWTYKPAAGHEMDAFAIEAEGFAESFVGGEALIYVDVIYKDGSALWGQKAFFPAQADVGWRKACVLVQPTSPVRHAAVYLMVRNGEGRFRFRKPAMSCFAAGESERLDCVAVCRRGTLPEQDCFLVRAAQGGGFALLTDGAAAKGVRLKVKKTPRNGAMHYDVTLTGTTDADRALTFIYAASLGEGEIDWFPRFDHREALKAADGERICGESVRCGVGLMSKWPVGAAAAAGKGVALCLDPEAPAVFRTGVNPMLRRVYMAFDVAVTREKPTAHFAFEEFDFNPAEGLRGAWSKYMALHPDVFKVRAPKQGVWMAFRKISTVPNHEDFGFAFKEGDNETAWDDVHGYYTFRYTEPTTWWMPIGGKDGRKAATMTECLAEADRRVQKGEPMAKGWMASAMKDEYGMPCGRIMDTPWCNGIVWNANSAPGIPGGDFEVKNGEPKFSARFQGTFPEGLDGEYVDSAEMYVTDDFDYDRSHFQHMETPLTWNSATKRPAVYKGMIGFEYVRAQAKKVHAKGRLMMANGVPSRWCWQIPYIDVTGTETNWKRKGQWTPDAPESLLYRRALCGGKPYCFLMNTDFSQFGYVETEKFMHRALAFGMFPGFFSQSATSRQGAHYFDHPEYYNPVRPLFKKFVPLAKMISEAGWRPVNRLVACADARIVSEQYGEKYATIFNPTDKSLTVTFTGKGLPKELVAGETWDFSNGKLTQTIPPETVRLLVF